METKLRFVVATFLLLSAGCATTTSTATTWTTPTDPNWARPGHVESVTEMVQRQQGNPAGGAVAGALIGGLLFGGRGPAALFGMASGAAVGAAASQGSAESRTYHMLIRFDDGASGVFVYATPPPFGPGTPVVLTARGIYPAYPTQ